MRILFLTRRAHPKIGGVERHVEEVRKVLVRRGHKVTIISEKDIKHPHIKFFGLLSIWIWLFKHRSLIEKADVVHCHDVFIWYLPFRFLYLHKKVVTTIHGMEMDNPLYPVSLWQKRLAVRLSNKSVGVGEFLEKYSGAKFDLITYGGITIHRYIVIHKERDGVVYVGRLEENTGLLKFLKWLEKNPGFKVDFCGDGPLRAECEKYGVVHGFTDPEPFYKKAEYCVPGGYLAALEALNSGCRLKLFWDTSVKENYWKLSPFFKLKGAKLSKWVKLQTWESMTSKYLVMYNSKK
jgi:glycosyltransferase involved in cell wall biosynthesis